MVVSQKSIESLNLDQSANDSTSVLLPKLLEIVLYLNIFWVWTNKGVHKTPFKSLQHSEIMKRQKRELNVLTN